MRLPMDHIGTVEKSLIQPTLSACFYPCLKLPLILSLLPSLSQVRPIFQFNKICLIIIFILWFELPVGRCGPCELFVRLDRGFKG